MQWIGRLLAAVLAVCCCLEMFPSCNGAYLEMHPDYSPPAVEPTDPVDMIYTSPANEEALLPYMVLLKNDSGHLINDNIVVTATTIAEGGGPDSYTGTLCRRSKRHYSFWPPIYYDDERIVCLSNTSYPLGYTQNVTYDGVARFEHLLHTMPSDGVRRQVLFTAEYNGIMINVTSNPITVHPEGAKLEIVQPTNFNDVYVNEPQTVVVQTMMEDSSSPTGYSALTVGRHSQLHVDLTISFDSKVYASLVEPGYSFHFQTLVSSSYLLGGKDVTTNAKEDLRIRKRCISGMATFEDVRILTVGSDVHLNITQTQPYWPWVRVPFHYQDVLEFPVAWYFNQLNLSATHSPAVAVSNGFDVLASTGVQLDFSEGVLDGFEMMVVDANLPFKKDLKVEVLDASGRVVTDGPDAYLEVVPEIDPPATCLSSDSAFKLSSGVGIFPGSVCQLGQNIMIRFSVTTNLTSTTLYTPWTPTFNVTGEIHIAGFSKVFGLTMYTGFFLGAADLINDGHWDDEVGFDFSGSGRKLVGKTFIATSGGPTDALSFYNEIRMTNADISQRSYSAIVGSYDEESTIELSTVSQLDKMPLVGYLASNDELALKDRHEYFSRVNSNQEAQFFTMGQFFQRLFMTKVLVMRSSSAPVPAAFYNGMAANQIEVVTEVVVPAATSSSDFTGLTPLDRVAERIKSSGTKIIVVLLDDVTLYYALHEAMRLGFACSDSYQWVVNGQPGLALPFKNQATFCTGSLGMSCTDAMRGLIVVLPQYLQSLDTGYWAETLFYYYVRRDPYETYTHQFAMTPPVYVDSSLAHDALITIFHGIANILKRNETIHGEKLNLELRKARFVGGSGLVALNSVGNRAGCELAVWNLVPTKEYPDNDNEAIYYLGQLVADENLTTISEMYVNDRKLSNTLYIPAIVEFAAGNYTNIRRFQAVVINTGQVEDLNFTVLSPYACAEGCGGGVLSNDSVFYYNQGTCVAEDTCECHLKENSTEYGYGLNNCSKVLCNPECKNGYCLTPDNCLCDAGWSADDCGTALCLTYGCDPAHGRCTFPDSCTCNPGYWSRDCSQPCSCQHGICIEGQTGTGTCSECDPGYYGVDCDAQCTCDTAHGNCSEGITGDGHCDACWEGYHGRDCDSMCTCESGVCDSGPGGAGSCLVCQPGYFGSNCQAQCSCLNGVCDEGPGGSGTCKTCDVAWAGANCELPLPAVIIPLVLLLIVVVTLLVLFGRWYYKRMRFRAELASNDWIIDYNDVTLNSSGGAAQSSVAFRSMVSLADDQMKKKDIVRNVGKWNGIDVVLKGLEKESVSTNMVIRLEVKAMRDLRHPNIANFVGCCVEHPNVAILMELAPKGSLDDLLTNESVKIDWNFKYSLLKDICRGMVYLSTSPIKSHGRLKSSNCVVDNRWTLKLTDFGLFQFKANQLGVPVFNSNAGFLDESVVEAMPDNSQLTQLLWTAPELLRTGVSHLDHVGAGSLEGDMYSLALIMVEMLTHDMPFSDLMDYLDVADILRAVAGVKNISSQLPQAWASSSDVTSDTKFMRPELPEDTNKSLQRLITSCWAEDPAERPSFSVVLKEFNTLSPKKGDLMDNLVSMLEQYSTNLEGIVAERTAELAAEKQKTEDLVCRMLPKQIAEQLKQGEHIAAESFDCVTIYFSDIVGFTKIAGVSTPFQVVDLLNDLYTCFDSIIDHFDVYKVETIGDAYMVVSGLPQRNGDLHAGEIATMSLHLLSAMTTFTIRHLPEQQLQLRIGMHSGPCVAGVVGLKMPRYCLFGDTVNTASRMESGGLALRIHMSENTAEILKRLGGYHLDCRGQREVKGKGTMTTYWLAGKDGYNKPLPTKEMMVSMSQHEFK